MLAEGRDVLIQAPWVEIFRPCDCRGVSPSPFSAKAFAAPTFSAGWLNERGAVHRQCQRPLRHGVTPRRLPRPSTAFRWRSSRGEIFGIVGESGSGKSTLANAVMGLLPGKALVSGSIRVDGREVVGLADSDLRSMRGDKVAMIFQDASASLDPTWPVGDQIAETVRAHRRGQQA